jgi:predicted nucleic acid-binding protein
MAALMAADSRSVSLTDWASFEVMRSRGLKRAFTFDRHFESQGFVRIPVV